jgi:hypothetical protein
VDRPLPIFEFVCRDRGYEFETQARSSNTPECPRCHSAQLAKKLPVFSAARVGSEADATSMPAAGPAAAVVTRADRLHAPSTIDHEPASRQHGSRSHHRRPECAPGRARAIERLRVPRRRRRLLRDGVLVHDSDRSARIRFETRLRNEYFDVPPRLHRYRRVAAEHPS